MSCLWASPSVSVPCHISSLSHTHTHTPHQRWSACPSVRQAAWKFICSKKFVCSKAFLQRSLIYNKWRFHLRHPDVVGLYFSLIDINYYIVMIIMEPWDGWLHFSFNSNEIPGRSRRFVRESKQYTPNEQLLIQTSVKFLRSEVSFFT